MEWKMEWNGEVADNLCNWCCSFYVELSLGLLSHYRGFMSKSALPTCFDIQAWYCIASSSSDAQKWQSCKARLSHEKQESGFTRLQLWNVIVDRQNMMAEISLSVPWLCNSILNHSQLSHNLSSNLLDSGKHCSHVWYCSQSLAALIQQQQMGTARGP